MLRHRADVPPHADGDDRAIDEFAIKVTRNEPGEQFALLVLVLVIDRNQRTLNAETLDQRPFEIRGVGIVRPHTNFDDALLQGAPEHAPDRGPGNREHPRQFFLRQPVDVVKRCDPGQFFFIHFVELSSDVNLRLAASRTAAKVGNSIASVHNRVATLASPDPTFCARRRKSPRLAPARLELVLVGDQPHFLRQRI